MSSKTTKTFRLPNDLLVRLEAQAALQKTALTNIVIALLESGLEAIERGDERLQQDIKGKLQDTQARQTSKTTPLTLEDIEALIDAKLEQRLGEFAA
jgi:predicted DNA-binding protein